MLNLTNELDLRKSDEYISLSYLSVFNTCKNLKCSSKNNKYKISVPTWNDKLESLDVLYSVSNILDYFKYIIKNHKTLIHNPPIRIHAKKIENKTAFKIKSGYYLELLSAETTKLLGSTENRIITDKNGKNLSHLEITELFLVSCIVLIQKQQITTN